VQSTGDGIFALFGAPVAHEDHPQRALHAALRMQDEVRRDADRQRAEGRAPLHIRVGANTGEVVVRSIATGGGKTEYTPIGHTANLAARMQTLANPGSTVIAESTRRLVEGYFTLKSLGVSRIKGVAEPVAVFEVTGLGPLRTRLQRSAGRGLTKFVGREREMEALKHAAEQARAGHGQSSRRPADPQRTESCRSPTTISGADFHWRRPGAKFKGAGAPTRRKSKQTQRASRWREFHASRQSC